MANVKCSYWNFHCLIRGRDNRALTELSFRHVTTKTFAYSELFGFFRENFWQKLCPPPPTSTQITFWKYNGKSICWYFYISFLIDFGPWKCPNLKIHESKTACFTVWALPEVQNQFPKQVDWGQICCQTIPKIQTLWNMQKFWW